MSLERQQRALRLINRVKIKRRREPAQAKAKIAKHLDGELTVRPLPSTGHERRAEIRGRAKLNGGVVAGARWMVGEPRAFSTSRSP
jgi:hypothetical protein